jgi:hypothetical protein
MRKALIVILASVACVSLAAFAVAGRRGPDSAGIVKPDIVRPEIIDINAAGANDSAIRGFKPPVYDVKRHISNIEEEQRVSRMSRDQARPPQRPQ